MVLHVEAIFTQGTFRPLEPFALREGTRVRLSIEEEPTSISRSAAKIHSPKLANPKDVTDFVMEVRNNGDTPSF